MHQQLERYLKQKAAFSHDELHQISSHFKPVKAKRGEMLVRTGDICKKFYFVNKGCLRMYEVDDKGNDITAYFALEDSIISGVTSFVTQKPSRDFLEAYEPSELLEINRAHFFQLTQTIPAFHQVYHQFVEFAFIHSQMRIYSFLGMEGIDKVRWVLEHEPKLFTRVSSKAVASYLGMTNSTLSKLKAKL